MKSYDSFSLGLEVYYKQHYGIIKFISDDYITIYIEGDETKFHDVCLVVPQSEFHLVTLIKQSEK